jgi:hypothetical protein
MSRLARFEKYRFIGLRDTMRVYDCDDPEQFEEVGARVTAEGLVGADQVQTFAPDTLDEARNRGFRF